MSDRPQDRQFKRWDSAFSATPLPSHVVSQILSYSPFKNIDPDDFPDDLRLADIIANDARIVCFERGEIIVSKGSFGDSVFMALDEAAAEITTGGSEEAACPGKFVSRNFFPGSSINPWHRETNGTNPPISGIDLRRTGRWFGLRHANRKSGRRIEDVDALVARHSIRKFGSGEIFGISGALTRGPRAHTVFATESPTLLLEIRWAGLRDLRQWSAAFANHIDQLYQDQMIRTQLRSAALFANLDEPTLNSIADQSDFETYGDFGWTHAYQSEFPENKDHKRLLAHEPLVHEQGHHLDGLILVCAGLGRVSETYDHGEKTVGILTAGEVSGIREVIAGQAQNGALVYGRSLRAIGYLHVIRIPTGVVEQLMLPALAASGDLVPETEALSPGVSDKQRRCESGFRHTMLDFLIDHRFINGARAMVINTVRCVNCDDCVRACAATHGNTARFIRRGAAHLNIMVANACMHCADPVCLIDCQTGAIHRDEDSGCVVIDETVCIGSGTCASACPYDNIHMAETNSASGAPLTDAEGVVTKVATKCDFCSDQLGGPACQRACPHGAIIRMDVKNTDRLRDWLGSRAW